MPITEEQTLRAQTRQHNAAHDDSPQVRLVAGPGTGKSRAIVERVRWLLSRSVSHNRMRVVSFTRASSLDLNDRVQKYCCDHDLPQGARVSVTTLHSLALSALRRAGLLAINVEPIVLDDYELEYVLDAEFSRQTSHSPSRCRYIREDYEAFCGTGQYEPINYIPPDPPITEHERQLYRTFHGPRTHLYACILPGDIVRQCVDSMLAGVFDPVSLLGIDHLILDEYQDFNPADLDFVSGLIQRGAVVFVAGDDDQSLYSFRFASPEGIQLFTTQYPSASDHELVDCFRCTPAILSAAQDLLSNFSHPTRIAKHLTSLYENSDPPLDGFVHHWRFTHAVSEARAIANSCASLIQAGLPSREIMILLSYSALQMRTLGPELENLGLDYEPPRKQRPIDKRSGRFLFSLIRIVCNRDDYVAHRLLLGLRPRVGPGICNQIANLTINTNLNYQDLFYRPLPNGVFGGRQLSALNHARSLCQQVSAWQPTDTIQQRFGDLLEIMRDVFGEEPVSQWSDFVADFPEEMNFQEIRSYIWTDTDERKASVLQSVYERLSLQIPEEGFLPQKIRISTIHGSKGLDSSVVFIPGLEEQILPGNWRIHYPGLVLEAARLLYVAIARAKAACILSYSNNRSIHGNYTNTYPSRFTPHLNGTFNLMDPSNLGLSSSEVNDIIYCNRNL